MSDVAITAFALLSAVPYAVRKTLLEKYRGGANLLEAVGKNAPADEEEREAFARIGSRIDLERAEADSRRLKEMGGWVLGYGSAGFPERLAEIPDPPLALYGLGTLPDSALPFLGFVGPRRPSTYGARVARMLAEDLVREKIVLVSGLARGIDAIAHEVCVKAGTPTIAVTACGLDRVYPPEHAHLAAQITSSCGAIVSEFNLREPPRSAHFPQRNRIISGLSRGVLVIEAGDRSGARITARHAAEQSRDVYAVPGPIDSPLSIQTNRLISQGAKLVATSADLFEDLIPGYIHGEVGGRRVSATEVSSEERAFLSHFERDLPRGADELVEELKRPVSEVLQVLLELQVKGLVVKQADARYVRVVGEV